VQQITKFKFIINLQNPASQHAGQPVTCRRKYVIGIVQGPMPFFRSVSKSVWRRHECGEATAQLHLK